MPKPFPMSCVSSSMDMLKKERRERDREKWLYQFRYTLGMESSIYNPGKKKIIKTSSDLLLPVLSHIPRSKA
jgi:hypothetical protein